MTITSNSPTAVRYYEHPGYSAIDHQLDPLIEIAVDSIADRHGYYPNQTPEQRAQEADRIAGVLEAAAAYIRSVGTPLEPLDLDCETCGAPPGQMCWNPRTYADNKHPHRDRVAAVGGLYRNELV